MLTKFVNNGTKSHSGLLANATYCAELFIINVLLANANIASTHTIIPSARIILECS